jgi:hypothetical protein
LIIGSTIIYHDQDGENGCYELRSVGPQLFGEQVVDLSEEILQVLMILNAFDLLLETFNRFDPYF